MDSILETLMKQVGSENIGAMASALGGADQSQVSTAIAGAIPMLVGALAKNSTDESGAGALLGALDRDHDGSILDDVAGFLGSGNTSPGNDILGHVLGGKRGNAESAIGQMSGLSSQQVTSLLAMLAPLVLGALGKKRRANPSPMNPTDLSSMLRQETARVDKAAPDAMGIFGKLLDQDGDGDMSDDIARLGTSLLGNLLKG